MKSRKLIGCIILVIALFFSGCAINRATADRDPSFDPAKIKSLYVVKQPRDGRDINVLIANSLSRMGYKTDTGVAPTPEFDTIATYEDRWQWDITVYMLELTIVIRDRNSNFPLATGHSMHTSLTRLTPQEMVDEVLSNIFKGTGNK
ncbi:MAG TPA: hypothetical protein VHO84_10960 [Syntrophorhabdaceae bacterium]|nr:hypothetical protein [Syntrophorhabdaceae bacterium]